MEKKEFTGLYESVYYEKLDNGLEIIFYITDKSKNYYASITNKLGARVLKYSKGNKTYEIIPGSAHFLEHKVLDIIKNKKAWNDLNKMGTMTNAWTSYMGTNYNIYGSVELIKNLEILLNLFFKFKTSKKSMENEKSIIKEEIDMTSDSIATLIHEKVYKNSTHNLHTKYTVPGEKEDIDNITYESLNRIYNDFYLPNNSFITICGNFNKDEVLEFIKKYIKKNDIKPGVIPKRIIPKEPDEVKVSYEELSKDINLDRVVYAIKMNKKAFNIKDDNELLSYLALILSTYFSSSELIYESYEEKGLIMSMFTRVQKIDSHIVFGVFAKTEKPDEFLKTIKKDIRKIKLSESIWDRKKKATIKSFVMDFDDITDIEFLISNNMLTHENLNLNEFDDFKKLKFDKALDIIKKLNFTNDLVIKINRKVKE